MADSRFFHRAAPLRLEEIATLAHVAPDSLDKAQAGRLIHDVCPLDRATVNDISFLDNVKYIDTFSSSRAGACFVRPKFASRAPEGMALLLTEDPYRSFALISQYFYPAHVAKAVISPKAHVAADATLGKDCCIDTGAVVEPGVVIGDNCHIGANAVLHTGVVLGNHTSVGANSTLSHCLIGNNVIIHRGVHIGQDGFGFALGREGHLKVPQLGRVIVEDMVEIGAGTCIDRGTGPDTVIGYGTKIDNLVQIGHNVQIGKHCIVVAQVGIAGSSRIGDGVMLGGQVGLAGHIKIGSGVKIVAKSGVMADIPAGQTYGGIPAVPVHSWHRQTIALAKLAEKGGTKHE